MPTVACVVWTLCAALGLAACSAPRTGSRPQEGVPAGTAERMSVHFAASVEIKDAVIAGDLRGVHNPARRLIEPTAYPASWAPFVADNLRLAAAAQAATNLKDAAQAAAGLANTCGACHVAVGYGPHFAPGHAPRRAPAHDTRRHMDRHQWAADRMWESLIAHDDASWTAGAAALSDTPLTGRDLTASADLSEELLGLHVQVVELGRQARMVSTWDERTRIYGEFLASCAGCHGRGS